MAAVSGATGKARARRPGAAATPVAAELTVTAGLCSVGAAAIHATVAAPHFEVSAFLGGAAFLAAPSSEEHHPPASHELHLGSVLGPDGVDSPASKARRE